MALPTVWDQIDRLFEELIHRPWGTRGRQLVPAEIREVEDGWIVQFPVEAVRTQDVQIDVHGRQLTVRGRSQHEHERQQGPAGWTRTRHEQSVVRTVTLPVPVNPSDIDATIAGGTLSVHVRRPKR